MGKAGIGLIKGIDVEEIVDTLDGYYCYNLVLMHFSHALLNRLEGQAAFLLVHLQERFWAMNYIAAYELAERTTTSLVNAHKASLSIAQEVS